MERTCAAQKGKEFLYKRDSMDKLVTRQSRLADPNHGTAIKCFRKSEDEKSKLDSIAVSFFGNMIVETGEIHIITKECIRTKDPSNNSDTETGTLSSQNYHTNFGISTKTLECNY